MTSLKKRIVEQIATNGPIPVNEYMALCLFDPRDGYYTNREPFGSSGDFVTAPEISQIFGELIGVWLFQAWTALGRPMPVTIAEIGPGRGTLMKDMLRTFNQLDPALATAASFAMIETSPRLTEIQKKILVGTGALISWHETLETLPQNPMLIVGNELFDAVPIRQFVRTSAGWRERMVGLENGQLGFFAGAASLSPSLLPDDARTANEGAIFEISPARSALMDQIAIRIAENGGAALFHDYGHLQPGLGDTFQALRNHTHEDVLACPGNADLTAHVDFSPLADVVRSHELAAHLTTQGEFLLKLGLLERAGALGANADDAKREKITSDVERLAGATQMGELFKVLAVLSPTISVPPFFR